ncbi:MAG: VanZ family protein, partial [Thermoanaerobaculia bacterium]
MSRLGVRRLWGALLFLAVAAVLGVTLRPEEDARDAARTNLIPLEHHGRALDALRHDPRRADRDLIVYYLASNVLGNVLLFVPVGLATAGLARERRAAARLAGAVLAGVALSTAVELLQLLVPGRATDVDDVLFNGLGALVGASVLLAGERAAAQR